VVFQKLFGRDNGKNSYKLAKNMISFYTSGMEVIVESSGQIGFDIDIMVRSSKIDKDVMLEFLHTQVMKPIYDLCAHPILGCQGVKLVEGILRPICVERLIPRIHREHQVVLVEGLQSIVLATRDFSYEHNWKEDGPLQGGHDDAQTLLGKKAWENILNRHLRDLQRLHKVLPCDSKHEELMATQPQWMDNHGDDVTGEMRIVDVQNLLRQVGRSLYHKIEESEINVVKRLDEMERRIIIKLNHIISMEKYMLPKICENINKLMTFSVELQQSQVPRLVYFTTNPKKSLKHIVTCMVPGITHLKIHFMCENREGFHIVGDQKGCDVTFGTDATRVFQTILVWGLRIFTILAKVGAHLTAGMGSMIPDLAKDFMLVIDTPGLLDGWKLPYVDETIDNKHQRLRITDDDKRIAEQWLIDFLKGKNLYGSFSLRKAMYKNRIGGCHGTIAWLCNEHIEKGENDSSLVLLPC
jgi:hypothetical protein